MRTCRRESRAGQMLSCALELLLERLEMGARPIRLQESENVSFNNRGLFSDPTRRSNEETEQD